jgi:2-amino-4-hydroxy-6-hydroxymethyldihydropteridine diphosphokinase
MTAQSPTLDTVPGTVAYIGFGGNLGDARVAVSTALDAVASLTQTTELARSSLYGSAPVDAGGADYVNAVTAIRTGLSALELLQALQTVEANAGRERPYRNAPRTLDLDILLYGDALIHTERLQVPHPRMFERAFVLVPLAEIAPALVSEAQLESVRTQGIWRL